MTKTLQAADSGANAVADKLTDLMLSELRNVAEGKPTVPGFGNPVWHLKCLGYVEERTIMKACKTCGTPQVDYRYDKITAAGREVLARHTPDAKHDGHE